MRLSLLLSFLTAVAVAGPTSAAQPKVAVLEFDVAKGLEVDRLYFSDRVRGAVGKRAPKLFVMTRESTEAILQASGRSLADCSGECEVETGRRLGADWVISGRIAKVGTRLSLTLRLHSTSDGRLLGSEEAVGRSADELVDASDPAAAALLGRLPAVLRGVSREEGTAEGAITEQAPALTGPASPDEVLVRLASSPPDAVALLDGQLLCKSTPCSRLVAPGPHDFSFQKEGYEDWSASLEARPGLVVAHQLLRIAAALLVETEPPGLPLSFDGGKAAPAPLRLAEVPAGAHEVVIDDPCWLRTGERVALKRGEERALKLMAKARTAGLKVRALDEQGNAVAATLVVDGQRVGSAPGTFVVPACARQLLAEGEGLGARERLELREGQVAQVELRMLPSRSGEAAPERIEPKSGLAFVRLPAGSYPNGDRRKEEVAVASFELGKTEVTVAAYERCVAARRCTAAREGGACNAGTKRTDHPINCVSQQQAEAFCAWIGGRLPGSEEWEYAAVGGREDRLYPWGNEPPSDGRLQWKAAGTAPVGTHPEGDGRWGLHDLAGNVWEWTGTDVGASTFHDAPPPRKEFRGGGFSRLFPPLVRSRDRSAFDPAFDFADVGLRCAFDGAKGAHR